MITHYDKVCNLMYENFKAWAFQVIDGRIIHVYVHRKNISFVRKLLEKYNVSVNATAI